MRTDETDHPIHPPSEFLSSEYGTGMPAPANYVIKSVDGVFHVFETEEAAQRGECLNYAYPVFKKYLDDVQRMCVMISDGPLYVSSFPLPFLIRYLLFSKHCYWCYFYVAVHFSGWMRNVQCRTVVIRRYGKITAILHVEEAALIFFKCKKEGSGLKLKY